MKILVTGSSGFIGSNLIPFLTNHEVMTFDAKDGQNILGPWLPYYIGQTDTVIHLAARTDVARSFADWNEYYSTNLRGTRTVASLCKIHKKKLIYASTAAVYDPTSSPYANSKKLAEDLVSYLLPGSVILRLFNVYGHGMNKSTMIARFKAEYPITIYGDGTQTRDFIHVSDVAAVIKNALTSKWNGFCGDIGTGRQRTVLSVAKRFGKPIRFLPARKEIYRSKADIRAMRKLYTRPFLSLNEAIDNLL